MCQEPGARVQGSDQERRQGDVNMTCTKYGLETQCVVAKAMCWADSLNEVLEPIW